MRRVEVTRTHVEMSDPSHLHPAPCPDPGARVERVLGCPASFFRYLYAEVGRGYFWLERIRWTDEHIRARLADPAVSLHLLTVSGAPAGYFELEKHHDGSVEVSYFGLLPEFHGRGLGKYLLTEAVREAWARSASRVWLHTCTLDHPGALANYLGRGFRPFRTDSYEANLPDDVTPSP
ncbi:MAG TPA: GNAT family N-acetyltransferase [Vicinamibacteria bacterium]|nr:GNAT family N-acetyltransferase [Vicinamibacteria bacterium]